MEQIDFVGALEAKADALEHAGAVAFAGVRAEAEEYRRKARALREYGEDIKEERKAEYEAVATAALEERETARRLERERMRGRGERVSGFENEAGESGPGRVPPAGAVGGKKLKKEAGDVADGA